MHTILIVVHLLIVLALVGVVLVQKSEGGGLGIGGGSGFMSARGAANTLTRVTGILATAFFVTSLALSLLARYGAGPTDILDRIPTQQSSQGSSKNSTLLDKLNGSLPQSSKSTTDNGTGTATDNAGQQPPSSGDTTKAAPSGDATPTPAAPAKPEGSGSGQSTTPPSGHDTTGGSGSQVPTGQ